ncbi:stress response protein AzuC [Escherichia coli]
MHCADEGFEKPLPHLFEAAVFLMGFTLWGKLEFNNYCKTFKDVPPGNMFR